MIEFKAVTLLDKEWIDQHVMCENVPSADYNFGNMFIWDEHYRQLVCSFGDRTLTKVRLHGEPAFVFPIGCGPLRPAMEAIREYAAREGMPYLRDDDQHRSPFGEPPVVCNYFYHEEIRGSGNTGKRVKSS